MTDQPTTVDDLARLAIEHGGIELELAGDGTVTVLADGKVIAAGLDLEQLRASLRLPRASLRLQ
jgi:hypothetical protein